METYSYFIDRSQDILEVLMGRIARLEANEEIPVDLPANDQQGLKQDYDRDFLPSLIVERDKGLLVLASSPFSALRKQEQIDLVLF